MTDATATPAEPPSTIATVESDIVALEALWNKAEAQYAARKASYAKVIDDYVATHQLAADAHTAEIAAATVIKAKLVPVVAAVATGAVDIEQFVLTSGWFTRVKAFFVRNKRWVLYGGCLIAMIGIYIWVK